MRSADQATVAFLVALSLAAIVGSWAYRHGLQSRLIDVDHGAPQPIAFQLDINEAPWPEWTLLPNIGEKRAKLIVESRTLDGPFRDHEDLMRVKGIGPRTLEQIRPYLIPMPDREAVAGP